MGVLHVKKDDFNSVVLESNKTVLVDFWATWCGPCRMIAPALEEIAAERSDIKVCKINVDEEQELAMQFGVSSIPTILVFKNGQVTKKSVGAVPKATILGLL